MALKNLLGQINVCALTIDIWTSINTNAYITITCHFVINFEIKTAVFATRSIPGNHTANNIALTIDSILIEYGIIEKVKCIVTDNAANMKAAVALVNKGRTRHFPCVAHTLNVNELANRISKSTPVSVTHPSTSIESEAKDNVKKKSNLLSYLRKEVSNSDQDSHSNRSDAFLIWKQYIEAPPIEEEDDPFIYWSKKTSCWGPLADLASTYLLTPASSTPSERVFSCAGYIMQDRRNRLLPEHVDMLVFLHNFLLLGLTMMLPIFYDVTNFELDNEAPGNNDQFQTDTSF